MHLCSNLHSPKQNKRGRGRAVLSALQVLRQAFAGKCTRKEGHIVVVKTDGIQKGEKSEK